MSPSPRRQRQPGAARRSEPHRAQTKHAAPAPADQPNLGLGRGAALPGSRQSIGQRVADRPDRRATHASERARQRADIRHRHILPGHHALQAEIAPARGDRIAAGKARAGRSDIVACGSCRLDLDIAARGVRISVEADPPLTWLSRLPLARNSATRNTVVPRQLSSASFKSARSTKTGRSAARAVPQARRCIAAGPATFGRWAATLMSNRATGAESAQSPSLSPGERMPSLPRKPSERLPRPSTASATAPAGV